jgi:hypothetical protein
VATPQAVSAELFIDGAWTAKTAFAEEGIELQVGPDTETGTRPNELTLTWDNSDLSIDPENVLSTLYGKIGRNTPARVVVSGTILLAAEASMWGPDRSINHAVTPARGRSWTDFEGRGVLSRLGRWTEPVRSPLYQQEISYASLVGLWPMEGTGTNLPNAVSGGFTGKVTGSATWAGDDGPGGSDKTIELGSDGSMSASFIRASVSDWQVCFAARIPAAPLTATYRTIMRWRTSTGLTYAWQTNNASYQVLVTRDDGTVAATIAATWGPLVTAGAWVRFRCKVTAAAGTITVEPAWYAQDTSTIYGTTGTFAGSTSGVLTNWDVQPNAYTDGGSWGHMFGVTDTTLNLTGDFNAYQAFNGYLGETAGRRYQRLVQQLLGISAFFLGNLDKTVPMGRQKPGRILELLEECATTDGALLYDEPVAVGLMFRTRIHRQAQTSKLDLTYGVDVAPPLKKIIDDVGVINRVTVTNASGASATKTLSTGPLSVLAPPNGVGEYKGGVDVNQSDDSTLDDRAAWELNRYTLRRARYKQVTVDLLANPGLVTACNAIRPGDLITLAGYEPDPIPLHVLSYTHKIGAIGRTYVMNCIPGDLWKTGAYNTTGRYNATSTLSSLTGTAGTTLVVAVPDPLSTWSTSATGYDLVIEGERVRVTVAFSAVAGGLQTATVTRSMNGVVRTHTVGATVGLHDPIHYAY